jgi:hypothetical protein
MYCRILRSSDSVIDVPLLPLIVEFYGYKIIAYFSSVVNSLALTFERFLLEFVVKRGLDV